MPATIDTESATLSHRYVTGGIVVRLLMIDGEFFITVDADELGEHRCEQVDRKLAYHAYTHPMLYVEHPEVFS